MKTFGGEMELKTPKLFKYLTDSGRSSLRLICKSVLKGKKLLVPDFLCQTILDILDETGVEYSFYKIKKDLSLDVSSIKEQKFDALYQIDYFGAIDAESYKHIDNDTLLIEDAVFLPNVCKPNNIKNWIGFNSLRKITNIADGSIILSTMKLDESIIKSSSASFSALKYKAKSLKYDYLHNSSKKNTDSERMYLDLFSKAESMLNHQKTIHKISNESLFNLLELGLDEGNIKKRISNYKELDKKLKKYSILKLNRVAFPCFYVMVTKNRDHLKKILATNNVYLPSFWSNPRRISNDIYDDLICVPIDTRYAISDIKELARFIELNMENHK